MMRITLVVLAVLAATSKSQPNNITPSHIAFALQSINFAFVCVLMMIDSDKRFGDEQHAGGCCSQQQRTTASTSPRHRASERDVDARQRANAQLACQAEES